MSNDIGGWRSSADAWIKHQGDSGDFSRREILDPCLEQIFSDVEDKEILDVGCGEGRYARRLGSRGAIVTGIDPVEAFIERARYLDPVGNYIVSGGEKLPFGDGSFDIVLSYLTIVDIPDYRSAIREMCRVVRPKGQIVVATISNFASPTAGWMKDESGKKICRAVDRYMEEFAMDLDWSDIRIQNFHRPLSKILQPFFEGGALMDGFLEPLPRDRTSIEYADEHRAPNFQIMTFRLLG